MSEQVSIPPSDDAKRCAYCEMGMHGVQASNADNCSCDCHKKRAK